MRIFFIMLNVNRNKFEIYENILFFRYTIINASHKILVHFIINVHFFGNKIQDFNILF